MTNEKEANAGLKMDFYTIVVVFAACCVAGYIVEMAWTFLCEGHFESRNSLVYGPFSVAYGMGGLLLTAVLYKLQRASLVKVFLVSMLAGTIVEYICSLGQELFFHSVAWDYSDLPLNINGRVCLQFSLFWGLLGVGWVKLAFPAMNSLARKFGSLCPRAVVWAFLAFFVFDCVVSGLAGSRMMERAEGSPPSNRLEQILDERFPDERIRAIYANSKRVE